MRIIRGNLRQTEGNLRGPPAAHIHLPFIITSHNLLLLTPQRLQRVSLLLFCLLDLPLTHLRRFIIDAHWVRTIEPGTVNFLSLFTPRVTCRETVCSFEKALLWSATPKGKALVAYPLQLLLIQWCCRRCCRRSSHRI